MNTTTIAKSWGVRKGAWSKEENLLLRKCIDKYGEGRWHLVPIRAGLNRCRKSCRLRWINYLRPHIKRGDFASDEIDLILRLQKLLGNRWSLIAGRLPGRTANDVKNYWNTHLPKKLNTIDPRDEQNINNKCNSVKITNNEIIRSQPRKLPINITEVSTTKEDDNNVEWWASLLLNANCNEEFAVDSTSSIQNLVDDEKIIVPEISKDGSGTIGTKNSWSNDFSVYGDVDLWGLLN